MSERAGRPVIPRMRRALAACFALAGALFLPAVAGAQCRACGDVNGDGRIDVVDAMLAAQRGARLRGPVRCPLAADLDGNHVVDDHDAVMIAGAAAGFDVKRRAGASAPCAMTMRLQP